MSAAESPVRSMRSATPSTLGSPSPEALVPIKSVISPDARVDGEG